MGKLIAMGAQDATIVEGIVSGLKAMGPKGAVKVEVAIETETKTAPVTNELYKRPNNATTPKMRKSVQGKPCVDCGVLEEKMVADHKKPLVEEHYETGKVRQGENEIK